MSFKKNKSVGSRLHPRNRNRERYDLPALIAVEPTLANYIKPTKTGVDSIDFSSPVAVKLLNKAILAHYYGVMKWDIPNDNLCPPIPGRADYIHVAADLLSENNDDQIPKGTKVIALDVGVGASCIYPIIGVTEYGWNFIGSDIDLKSIKNAQQIVESNAALKGKVDCRIQENPKNVLKGIIGNEELIDIVICNPPFHASKEEAQKGSLRKVRNLSGKNANKPTLNFGGINSELIYEGGERAFIDIMIKESANFAKNCCWFTTLVSKQENLNPIYSSLEIQGAAEIKTIPISTGNKASRIVAWTYLSTKQLKAWRQNRRG